MNTPSQTHYSQLVPPISRTPTVEMGRLDYLSVLFRLVATELYKLRRRMLSKVLMGIAIGIVVLLFTYVGISLVAAVNRPVADFAQPLCSQVKSQNTPCVNRLLTQAQLTKLKQDNIKLRTNLLSLPGSLTVIDSIVAQYGMYILLICILTGTIVGGEYSIGTTRLFFTRGPARLQFLLAKVLTVAICAIVGFVVLTLIGVALGYAFYPIAGTTPDFHFFTAAWFGHTLCGTLVTILSLFTYAMISLLFGTLGRSIVAGIISGITWFSAEFILNQLIPFIATLIGGSAGKFVGSIPDYFVVNNSTALLLNLHIPVSITNGDVTALSTTHALLVFAGYLVVCIGLSCWLTVKRDVTN